MTTNEKIATLAAFFIAEFENDPTSAEPLDLSDDELQELLKYAREEAAL